MSKELLRSSQFRAVERAFDEEGLTLNEEQKTSLPLFMGA